MWNYIHYKAYLNEKEKTEYNGNESYVWNKIVACDLSWFPIKRTKIVKTDDEEVKKSKTGELINNYHYFNTRLKNIVYRIN